MERGEVRREPYHYRETAYLSVSTVDASYEFERKPDEIVVTNAHASSAIYINFDEVASTTKGYVVLPSTERRFYLDARSIHAVVSSGTATLAICGLAYEDVRLKA